MPEEIQGPTGNAAPEKKSGVSCLKIAGIGCLLFLIVGGVTVYYVVTHFKSLAISLGTTIAIAGINESEMSDEQKKGFIKHIERIAEKAKNDQISEKQLKYFMNEISRSPLLPMAMVSLADNRYVQPSGLTADEKKRGTLDLQRFGRGVVERDSKDQPKISAQSVEAALDMVAPKNPGNKNQRQFKKTITDTELKKFLALVRSKADEVEIPEEAYQIDPAAEFGKLIDRALAAEDAPDATDNQN
jgi:hypothetical protein